ncbi:alpha/beta fold hydrolase [Bradyrhizobium sp. SBR1B]|uniref:alpha/beta hydrolase family protein n=1 Tax=Bradyrhizobium sp. SBR1B TaxID=2663836 RepID=UPI0017D161BB|nr:alpha/beta fold hydrolase [Bradyrhizobium sp. SBR1B]MBB4378357.1 putative dienelactone hydrolase [Bradyrhizobium sp. SBR1B]
MVIFSHGRGAWFGAHHDTAEALADAGFAVAAINHPGDNANDSSRRDTLSVWGSRPADMVRLLNFLLKDWKDRDVVDHDRIGLFGFSLGGYTGLVLAGANPDTERFAARCTSKIGSCAELHSGASLPSLPRDTRIKAAVLADAALSTAFTQESVKGVQIPLQVWRSELGGYGVDAGGTSRLAGILPGHPKFTLSRPITTHFWRLAHLRWRRPIRASASTPRQLSIGKPFIATSIRASFGSFGSISLASD